MPLRFQWFLKQVHFVWKMIDHIKCAQLYQFPFQVMCEKLKYIWTLNPFIDLPKRHNETTNNLTHTETSIPSILLTSWTEWTLSFSSLPAIPLLQVLCYQHQQSTFSCSVNIYKIFLLWSFDTPEPAYESIRSLCWAHKD